MKTIATSAFLFLISFTVISQNETGGEYPMGKNDASNPCISPEQYKIMEKQIQDNCKMLGLPTEKVKSAMATSCAWPLRMANGLNDCSYYAIVNYVDQDTSAGLKDWNCGAVTYDGHRGNDIATFPYPFYKMDNNQIEVIAAAPGTIVNRVDGNFDKNCAASGASPNYVAIQHADGSIAIYYHMKMNSLTVKVVGQTVVAGEYLGVVGSSGSSTGPHLHFEVWATVAYASLNDAYAGPCNSLNASSWWISQKPYTEPAVVEASVHPVLAVFPACPATETPNEDSCFTSGATAKFYLFIRDETPGLVVNERIVNPGGTTFSSWVHNSVSSYKESYWIATKPLPTIAGTYTFETIYNGITCSKQFKINCAALTVPDVNALSHIEVFPNPSNGVVNITGSGMENGNYVITLKNVLGQTIETAGEKIMNNTISKTITTTGLPNGIYFLTIETGKARVVKKLILEN